MSKGRHTSWAIPEPHRDEPAYLEADAAIAPGQAVYDRRTALGLGLPALARRTGLTVEDAERSEGGGTVPALALLRLLAAAPDAAFDVSVDTAETHVSFTPHAA